MGLIAGGGFPIFPQVGQGRCFHIVAVDFHHSFTHLSPQVGPYPAYYAESNHYGARFNVGEEVMSSRVACLNAFEVPSLPFLTVINGIAQRFSGNGSDPEDRRSANVLMSSDLELLLGLTGLDC